MSLRFAVVHEAEADFQTATELADRELLDAIDWLDEVLLGHQRDWIATASKGERLTWTAMKHLAQEENIRVHGHFDGEPGFPDAAAARRAILYLLKSMPDINAIILLRDQDDQPERSKGLEQARNQHHQGVAIVVGFAIIERECWVLSGFEPRNVYELSQLESERKTLGFDPRLRSHELTACKDDNARHSSKRVLRELTRDDRDRQRLCWTETPLQLLRQQGKENGLAVYLDEVRVRLAPLIGHAAPN